ncbi:MAG: transglutaminase domain-containing protein [Acidobacteria bacterium]|nr:transglutaminase domain-containing protein [Acidobacteriota bacterium]MBV9147138.1 transglutaminase domain-containing protein [Acidobacteriota bacterium]MBV9437689.1 transglutaminase domain-containing protein [Acidobacteriota bacterium]
MRVLRVILPLFLFVFASAESGTPERHFTFHYAFTVHNINSGFPLRIWIPLAHSDDFQTVRVISQTGDLPLRRTRAAYGNEMLFAETGKADKQDYSFEVVYDVVRRQSSAHAAGLLRVADRQRLLSPDKLVPVKGIPAELAERQAANVKGGDYEKARAFYEYVLANMRYDKSGTGWGHGDALYACSAKHGNCTDFHALFISMARSQHIPARFEIGFSIPTDKHSGEIPGYHCWADFYSQNRGWIPVDISEAWKHPEQREFFFGHWDENRVQFSVGRDIRLSPTQAGEALNYFVYPYVELGGQQYLNVANHFSFEDVGTRSITAAGN